MSRGNPEAGAVLAPPPPAGLRRLTRPPTFSVVIPAYQAAATIATAVRSALDQVVRAHEVIVVDDGSTDDLEGALREFEGSIDVVHKPNGGAASARNAGITAASGDFMAVLDADDRFHPHRLEALSELAQQRPDLDLLTTDTRFIVGGEDAGSFLVENPFAVEDQRTAILGSCFVGGWPAARLDRLREIGGFDESLRVGHDWDCWVRLVLDGSRAGLVNLPYYDYVVDSGGLTAGRVRSLWDRVGLLEKASRNPALRAGERPVLERELRRRRDEAVRAEIGQAGSGDRRRLLGLSTRPGLPPRTRLLAVLAAVAPLRARQLAGEHGSPEERLAGDR